MFYSNRSSFFLKIKSITQNKSSLFTKKIIGCFFIGTAILILCVPVINNTFQTFESFFDEKLAMIHSGAATINYNIKKINENFWGIFSLLSENKKLKYENERLKAIAAQFTQIKLENKKWKSMNRFVFPKTIQVLSTRLIFRSDGQVGMAKILVGRKDGIKYGQFVISDTGALVGKIINISNKTAKILLINEPKSKISVIFPRINNKAILSGNFQDNLDITFTQTAETPIDGDLVITSGEDGSFPAGFIVGTVVTSKAGQQIVRPMVNPKNIEFVSVLEFNNNKK